MTQDEAVEIIRRAIPLGSVWKQSTYSSHVLNMTYRVIGYDFADPLGYDIKLICLEDGKPDRMTSAGILGLWTRLEWMEEPPESVRKELVTLYEELDESV
jgi:hypothetical protein